VATRIEARMEPLWFAVRQLGVNASSSDLVVHGAGRVADLDDLNLASAGVQADKRGVKVNEFFRAF